MKIYILTTKHDATLLTFKSFDELIEKLKSINKDIYDNRDFGLFGQPFDYLTGENLPYTIDSAVLTKKENYKDIYHTFIIHAIDTLTGQKTELI